MGIKEAHALFQESMAMKVEFDKHGDKFAVGIHALFPCLEKARSALARAQETPLGSPQRSILLREFGEVAISCAKHTENIKIESGYLNDLLERLTQQHVDIQKALTSTPLN